VERFDRADDVDAESQVARAAAPCCSFARGKRRGVIDRFLRLVRETGADTPLEHEVLGPPRFLVPLTAEVLLGLPCCAGCGHGVIEGAHGIVRWGEREFHPTCAHDELLALLSAA
jgi:hypothetical protein